MEEKAKTYTERKPSSRNSNRFVKHNLQALYIIQEKQRKEKTAAQIIVFFFELVFVIILVNQVDKVGEKTQASAEKIERS